MSDGHKSAQTTNKNNKALRIDDTQKEERQLEIEGRDTMLEEGWKAWRRGIARGELTH